MVIFDFTSSSIVLCLILFMVAGNTSIALIGVIMVLLSIISSLYTPAVTASIPLLVEESKLEGTNGIVQAVQALSQVAAPILGGILYGIIGVGSLIVISCIAFFLSAVMEIFIKIPFVKREHDGHIVSTIMRDMKDGFAYVVKQPFILKAMIIAALLNLVLSPLLIVGSPIILRVTMQSNDNMYGVGLGLINFASILGAVLIGALAKKMRVNTVYLWIIAIALLLLPIAVSVMPFMLGLGYYPAFILFMLGAIPIAAVATILSIYIIAKVQRVTPNENLGKVMAIIMAVAQCAAPLGQILYGVIFKSFSAALYLPVLVVSLIMLVIAFISQQILRKEGEPA